MGFKEVFMEGVYELKDEPNVKSRKGVRRRGEMDLQMLQKLNGENI